MIHKVMNLKLGCILERGLVATYSVVSPPIVYFSGLICCRYYITCALRNRIMSSVVALYPQNMACTVGTSSMPPSSLSQFIVLSISDLSFGSDVFSDIKCSSSFRLAKRIFSKSRCVTSTSTLVILSDGDGFSREVLLKSSFVSTDIIFIGMVSHRWLNWLCITGLDLSVSCFLFELIFGAFPITSYLWLISKILRHAASIVSVLYRIEGPWKRGGLPICAAATAAAIDETSPGQNPSTLRVSLCNAIIHTTNIGLNKTRNTFVVIVIDQLSILAMMLALDAPASHVFIEKCCLFFGFFETAMMSLFGTNEQPG